MTIRPVQLLSVFYEPEQGRRHKVGRLATKDRQILFEYDPGFIDRGLELSPFKLPLRPGVVVGDPALFHGLMGLFEDSLPDGWGRLLIDRRAAKAGLRVAALGPLDRLALVGGRAMGALVYEPEVELEPPTVVSLPEIAAEVDAVLHDVTGPDLDKLIALGGSPQGARPKALVQIDDRDGTVVYGDRLHRAGCTPYLVKFRARDDDRHAGTLEHVYMRLAADAGIAVARTRMLGRTRAHPGYLAVQRFDRDGTRKRHMHTLAGLLHAPHVYSSVTYRDLLLATRRLTRDESSVAEMFRRACFNVFSHNRDDHTRNFAFLLDERGAWRPTPAYDLTFSPGPGGEHSMLVGTEGANPTEADLRELAASVDLKRPDAIIEAARAAVRGFPRRADQAGLPRKVTDEVWSAIEPRLVTGRAQAGGRGRAGRGRRRGTGRSR
jgi:serine/threonine-protein kinase HipA